MKLCLDVGNSQIHIGIFSDKILIAQFRYTSNSGVSSDQFGLFLKLALNEKKITIEDIKAISICSVVPSLDYSIRSACIKYFNIKPFFLAIGSKTGLKLKYQNPAEIGADRVATAIAAEYLYPNKNLVIVDMGTATTICILTETKEYLAGAIVPGIKSSAKALSSDTAKLPSVDIAKPSISYGKSTKDNIQIGLYYGHIGAIKEIIKFLVGSALKNQKYYIIGTGGFSELYKSEELFDHIIPELALIGLNRLVEINK
jgi:type III pantothenate kinase